jgi:transcriptional regulator with XRE-family HTH domain
VDVQKALGRNIRALREGQGLSQEALAERSDIHPVQMGRVERGVHDTKASTVVKIAHGLGVPAGALWDGL